MAIVLIIIGLVTGALLLPLQEEYSQLSQSQTETTLANAKQALLGYAQQNGRLPCPASSASNIDAGSYGQENPLGGTRDSTTTQPPVVANTGAMQSGFLPAATLGLQATDKYGFALDAWNNRLRYAISTDDSSSFASPRNASPFITVSTTHQHVVVVMRQISPHRVICRLLAWSVWRLIYGYVSRWQPQIAPAQFI